MMLAGIGLWIGLLVIAGLFGASGIGILELWAGVVRLLWLGVSIGIPIAWYLDMRVVRKHSSWSPTPAYYLLGSLIVPYITIPYYFYKRRQTVGAESLATDANTFEPDSDSETPTADSKTIDEAQ